MNATIQSWFARSTLIQGTLHTIVLPLIKPTTLVSITRMAKSKNCLHHLPLFSLIKLFLMSFSYIGNVVSAQLIHKETPPALIGLANILRGGGVWQFYGLCDALVLSKKKGKVSRPCLFGYFFKPLGGNYFSLTSIQNFCSNSLNNCSQPLFSL